MSNELLTFPLHVLTLEVVIQISGLKMPRGIAIDWVAGNVYWTDSGRDVIEVAGNEANVKAVSFNFHTPYPDTAELMLSSEDTKFAGILCAVLSQHYLLGFEIAQLEFHHLH